MSNIEFTKKDLENVATLSRLSLSEEEKEKFLIEMKEVLSYVAQVSEMSGEGLDSSGGAKYGNQFLNSFNKNEMREDIILNKAGENTEKLLADAPAREGDFVKVSKVIKK